MSDERKCTCEFKREQDGNAMPGRKMLIMCSRCKAQDAAVRATYRNYDEEPYRLCAQRDW